MLLTRQEPQTNKGACFAGASIFPAPTPEARAASQVRGHVLGPVQRGSARADAVRVAGGAGGPEDLHEMQPGAKQARAFRRNWMDFNFFG